MAGPPKKVEAKVAKAKKPKSKKASMYEVSEDHAKRKNKACPKCGPGVFMAMHEKRNHCGKCGFTEWH